MRVGRNPYLVTTRLFHTTRLLESLEYIYNFYLFSFWAKKTRETAKLTSFVDEQAEIQQRKLLVKKKKKAKFELPHPNVVKSLPRATTSSNPKRLQRRISSDFVPIFDLGDIQG